MRKVYSRNFCEDNHKIAKHWKYTCIPNCPKTVRRVYIKGADAFLPNLPHPIPEKLDSFHSYISIHEIIAQYLALAVPIQEVWSLQHADIADGAIYSTLYETPAVRSIVNRVQNQYPRENVLILLGIEFYDDFDPNNSIKCNRQSIWMKCMSISPPKNNLHGMTTTFPMSFGPKDRCHEVVEEKLCGEILDLSNPKRNNIFYHKKFCLW